MQQMMQMMAGRRDAGVAGPNAPPKQLNAMDDARLLQQSNSMDRHARSLKEQVDRKMLGRYLNPRDPLAQAEQALQRLRQHPDDKHAANELQRALDSLRLRQERRQAPQAE